MSKKKQTPSPSESPTTAPAPAIGTSLKGLLSGIRAPSVEEQAKARAAAEKKAREDRAEALRRAARPNAKLVRRYGEAPAKEARPSDSLTGAERIAFLDALSGVQPMGTEGPKRVGAATGAPRPPKPEERDRDAHARAKLEAFVAGGVSFDVAREEDWVEGVRSGAKRAILDSLRRSTIAEDCTLDLHGDRAELAAKRVVHFVRERQQRGVTRILIVHGKGLHSPGGGVLCDVVVETLTKGGAAPFVLAFVTAERKHGGAGALVVELAR